MNNVRKTPFMRIRLLAFTLGFWSFGCAAPMNGIESSPPENARPKQVAVDVVKPPVITVGGDAPAQNTRWLGASALSSHVMAGTSETTLGIWVDVPANAKQAASGAAVALVVDTSGSMAGPPIRNARSAAIALVNKLRNGDLLSLYSFADDVQEHQPLTAVSDTSRSTFISAVDRLVPNGRTNLFEGLRSGERSAFGAAKTHPNRRVVLISDGKANVGPTTPEALGALSERGAEHGIQVTAIGVGLDYDERTLNALAMKSSGRLYHVSESSQLTALLEEEMGRLKAAATTGAFIDIMPAPGVTIVSAEEEQSTQVNGATRIMLGSMFAGQHREMLVRVRVTTESSGGAPLASVRFHYSDPSDGNVERVQETVARYQVTTDRTEIAANENRRTREIVMLRESSKTAQMAAETAAKGDATKAAKDLAQAEEKLLVQASTARDEAERQRISQSAANITKARKAMDVAAAAPAAARPKAARAAELEANEAGMRNLGR